MPAVSIIQDDQGIGVISPWNPEFLDKFKKQVPPSARRWDKPGRLWYVDEDYLPDVVTLLREFFGNGFEVPVVTSAKPARKTLRVEYIGQVRDRGPGVKSAYGYRTNPDDQQLTFSGIPVKPQGIWDVEFPEAVLRSFFHGGAAEDSPSRPGSNFYFALGVKENARLEEIKSAYRRRARQWHPDVCSEPDAAAMFRVIQEAYETLSDPTVRRKYDAGLYFERSLKTPSPVFDLVFSDFRIPLRCGVIVADGQMRAGRFKVANIISWDDIVNAAGLVLVSSWTAGAEEPSMLWVEK